MTRPPSVKRLLVQVVLLAGVLVLLSRWGGGGRRAPDPAAPDPSLPTAPGTERMSAGPPDLTFYNTLGDAAPPGGASRARPPAASLPQAAPSGGAFVVQGLATRDAAAARRLRDRMAAAGFAATLAEDTAGGRPVYRVRLGRYRTRDEAEAAARVLRSKHHLNPWILQEGP